MMLQLSHNQHPLFSLKFVPGETGRETDRHRETKRGKEEGGKRKQKRKECSTPI